MNRIEAKFNELRRNGQAAFIPFITAGDPDMKTTESLILEFEKRGADLIELGFPFSDPIADGPVIQASYTRALDGGARLKDIFALVSRVRQQSELPIVAMVSYSIAFKKGYREFIGEAVAAGIDGATVPDLPVEEAGEIEKAARDEDFLLIFFTAPTTTPSRRRLVTARSKGFIYYISVAGITGVRDQLPPDMAENISLLKKETSTPICLGFGVSTPQQARAVAGVADGVIVGSAIVRLIEENVGKPRDRLVETVGEFVGELARGAKEVKKAGSSSLVSVAATPPGS